MRTISARRALAVLIGAGLVSCMDSPAAPTPSGIVPRGAAFTSIPLSDAGAKVVISQVYGGGGNATSVWKNDFIELYNNSADSVDLSGASVQYASAAGSSWQVTALSGKLGPGNYYLISEAAQGGGTTSLPAADASGAIPMSATAGKVVLTTSTTAFTVVCPAGASVIDFVGFGSTANCFEGTGPTPAPSNTNAVLRKNGGQLDNNQNATDFAAGLPNPRNTQTPPLTPIPTLRITVTPASASAQVGQTVNFTASATFGGAPVAITSAAWTSGNLAVATIDANSGVATAVTRGGSTISVNVTTASNGSAIGTAPLTVSGVPATVSISPASPTVQVGKTATLTASAVDADGFAAPSTFTWDSNDENIATVDASTGVVTGVALGTVTIHATSANGKIGSATLTVTAPPAGISLSLGTSPLVIGYQTQIFVNSTSFDASGHPIHASDVTWSSSDANIVSVDSHGLLTASGSPSAVITVTAADGTTGTITVPTEIPIYSSTARTGHNTEFGVPTDGSPANDVIIERKQYTISYNPQRGGPNWVSWNLDATHIGTRNRCNCYSADTALVRLGFGQYMYNTLDYTNGGYDRGHMEPSADQTTTDGENATTFFLTNFLPQQHNLNAGPWENLENDLRDSVNITKGNREAYIIAGGVFTNGVGLGTLKGEGKIAIPDSTWKIVVLMPAGTGLANVASASDVNVIAVNMPNVSIGLVSSWASYKTTVHKLERSTGYDFLSSLPKVIQCAVNANCAPHAAIGGSGVAGGNEGQTLAFSASGSTDADGDALSYSWSIDGQPAGSAATMSHLFADNGTYNVTLIAFDGFAADTTTTAVTVLNVAPAVSAFAGGSANKGVAFTSSGSFTDPGNDTWTATVDYGDGSGVQPLALSGKNFSLSHIYAASGSYTVSVRVTETDPEAASGVNTATVTVVNIAPIVNAFAGATILGGETYASTGSFTDPDPDTFAATVDYGDGTGSRTLALAADKSFSLSHVYANAGTFTVTVTVVDGEATASRTAAVVVKSGAQGVGDLGTMVASLTSLNNGQRNSLQSKLDAATAQIGKGNSTPAVNQLQAFISELQADVSSGKLTDAQRVIATISST
jgi:DNA/RNA endonuclease G (NUC1)